MERAKNVPGWTAPAARSYTPEAPSLAWSRVDFWESGVAFSLACSPRPLRLRRVSKRPRRTAGSTVLTRCQTCWLLVGCWLEGGLRVCLWLKLFEEFSCSVVMEERRSNGGRRVYIRGNAAGRSHARAVSAGAPTTLVRHGPSKAATTAQEALRPGSGVHMRSAGR